MPMSVELETQQAFRTIMRAMADPGSIHRLGSYEMASGAAGLELIAETLFDQDVTFCVIGEHHAGELGDRLYERTKSRMTEPSLADFIIIGAGEGKGRLLAANRGTPESPDRGSTALFSVESLAEGSSGDFSLHLSGPGIPGERYLQIRGVAHGALRDLREVNSQYPLGVDSIFVDNKDCIACIPRSSRIRVR